MNKLLGRTRLIHHHRAGQRLTVGQVSKRRLWRWRCLIHRQVNALQQVGGKNAHRPSSQHHVMRSADHFLGSQSSLEILLMLSQQSQRSFVVVFHNCKPLARSISSLRLGFAPEVRPLRISLRLNMHRWRTVNMAQCRKVPVSAYGANPAGSALMMFCRPGCPGQPKTLQSGCLAGESCVAVGHNF